MRFDSGEAMKRLVVLLFAVAERAFSASLASGARTAVLLFFPSGFFPSGLACFAGVVTGSGCRRVSSLFVFVAERERKRGRRMGG